MMRHRKKHAGAPPRAFDDDDDSNGVDDRGKILFGIYSEKYVISEKKK
jgi:hypothetical protein